MDFVKKIVLQLSSIKVTQLLWFSALSLALLSLVEFSSHKELDKSVARFQSKLHKRQEVLHGYAQKVLEMRRDLFIEIENFPEDMVIYRYFDDTLHSWLNSFPIANDDIDYYPSIYRINHFNSRAVTNTPLAHLSSSEQYVNLGSAWYIVELYRRGNQTVVAGVLVETDYSTENSALSNRLNPKFSLNKRLSITPLTLDECYMIKGRGGSNLFSIIKSLPSRSGDEKLILRWLALLMVALTLFLDHYRIRNVKSLSLFIVGLTLIRIVAVRLSKLSQGEFDLFSPNLYADHGLFSSLGDLLMNNLVIFLISISVWIISEPLSHFLSKRRSYLRKLLAIPVALLIPTTLWYIHYTIGSLIVNSNITMEPFRINEISIYTLLIYISYSLLFVALLILIQLLALFLLNKRETLFREKRFISLFISAISIYTLITVSVLGARKEYDKNRVLTTKISIERDLNLELQLRRVQYLIEKDHFIFNNLTASTSLDVINRNLEYVHNRLSEAYLLNILQRYDLHLTACLENTFLIEDSSSPLSAQLCNSHFEALAARHGSPLGEGARFFFMNNYDGKISYLGIFTYIRGGRFFRLYVQLESKFLKESIGFPDLLIDNRKAEGFNIPYGYSFGKYLNGRLVSHAGNFNYPIRNETSSEYGYKKVNLDGYIHFVNSVSDENLIVMSRKVRSPFPYLVSLSYLLLLYSLFILTILRVKIFNLNYKVAKNSFRWKVMILILSALFIALLALGAGSSWLAVRYFNNSINLHMEEKLNSIHSSLSYLTKYANRYNDPNFNNLKLLEEMNRLSGNTSVDINIYRPDGLLLRTTRSEIFDRFLLGTRMDAEAYRDILYNNKKELINRESIGDIKYYSLYAPLFNNDGKLIAILNIPYFSRQSDFREEAASIIATIINIYILLMVASLFLGVALSNSIARPLIEISEKMQFLDISEKPEYINYFNNDELGILVTSYNKMVDHVNESTQLLAQSEREQAWREMARQIAHEIKNPLTPMRLSIQHLMRLKAEGVEGWSDKFELLGNSLIEQIDILSEAASEFSSFSRFYSEELTHVNLKQLIEEQIILFDTDGKLTINLEYKDSECCVTARKNQLTRLFVNLISNAVQAVEKLEQGEVLITVDRVDQVLQISIEDNGPGVEDSLVGKLFQPNFTTKSGGTGLGLAICKSIVSQSGGSIHYSRSERLGGAAFVMTLPELE